MKEERDGVRLRWRKVRREGVERKGGREREQERKRGLKGKVRMDMERGDREKKWSDQWINTVENRTKNVVHLDGMIVINTLTMSKEMPIFLYKIIYVYIYIYIYIYILKLSPIESPQRGVPQ